MEIDRHNLGLGGGLRVFLPFFLPVVKARNGDFSVLGVGEVHGFGVVPECLLGEALRVTAFAGALGPRIIDFCK